MFKKQKIKIHSPHLCICNLSLKLPLWYNWCYCTNPTVRQNKWTAVLNFKASAARQEQHQLLSNSPCFCPLNEKALWTKHRPLPSFSMGILLSGNVYCGHIYILPSHTVSIWCITFIYLHELHFAFSMRCFRTTHTHRSTTTFISND